MGKGEGVGIGGMGSDKAINFFNFFLNSSVAPALAASGVPFGLQFNFFKTTFKYCVQS